MSRNYGNDSESANSARESIQQMREQDAVRKKRIDVVVAIGAITIAAIGIIVNAGKCVSATKASAEFQAQKIEADEELKNLSAKLQDPSAQNLVYKDPAFGNMGEKGTAIADMQNRLISSRQNLNVDATTETSDVSDTGIVDNSADRGRAELIKEFQQKYFASNLPGCDTGGIDWTWYGQWSFSSAYDFATQGDSVEPNINGVWACYEPSDVGHLKPLSFVIAKYNISQQMFSEPRIIYTGNYVKLADAQKNAFKPLQLNEDGDPEDLSEVDLPDDNEQSPENDESSSGDEEHTDDTTQNTVSDNTVPVTNSNGTASWSPGSGTSSNGSNKWQPSDNDSAGQWSPSDGSSSGQWSPSNSNSDKDTNRWKPSK